MNKRKTILRGVGIALICSGLGANASMMKQDKVDNFPVDTIYVKAGAGVSVSNTKFTATNTYDRKAPKSFPTYHIGLGYKLHEYFRSDVTFQYAELKYKSSGPTTTGKQDIQSYAAFLNGYLDTKSYCNFMAYLTAGIGIGHNRAGNFKDSPEFTLKGKKMTNFIYNLGFGVQYHPHKRFAVDLGYRYMDLAKAKTLSSFSSPTPLFGFIGAKQRIRTQQIVASLIYKF